MRRLICIYFISLVIIGCGDSGEFKKPKDLIPEDKMIQIYTESYLSNAARSVNNRMLREKGIKLDSLIYSKFGIDSLQFASSNAYYSSDISKLESMYRKVEQNLLAIKIKKDSLSESLKPVEDQNPISQDSTNNAAELLVEPATSDND